jgi:peptidoglycan-associated lipoprotein
MYRAICLAVPLASAALLSACASATPPPSSVTPQTSAMSDAASWERTGTERTTAGSEMGSPLPSSRSDQGSSLVIDERIRSACGIVPMAHFDFDSDEIEGDAASVLDSLAECLTSGPLANRRLRIVGHTDPRGERYHNVVLGQKRATGVAFYLRGHGVDLLNVQTMTMGSKEAVGTDKESWALDRRVEISLLDE